MAIRKAKAPAKKISPKKARPIKGTPKKVKRSVGKRGPKAKVSPIEKLVAKRFELKELLIEVRETHDLVLREVREAVESMTTEFRETAESLEAQITDLEKLVESEEEVPESE